MQKPVGEELVSSLDGFSDSVCRCVIEKPRLTTFGVLVRVSSEEGLEGAHLVPKKV